APEPDRFYRRVWRWLVNPLVSLFVCNSRFTESEVLACGINRSKVLTIYNTVPTRTLPQSVLERRADRVIYVGQIIPEKGLECLLDAIGLLVDRRVPVTLDIVGAIDGWAPPEYVTFREHVRALVGRAPLNGVVRLLGWRGDV